uniref:Uncharacterized protein n=1 Tax=viral metagenome TaxID=1070528 RepID=A0A6C0DUG0_9ZZZZ
MTRIDYIFSYWIFLWYLLYLFGIVNFNPKFAILCGVIENIGILLLMFYYGTKKHLVLLFLIMFILLKIIPLYSIWNTQIRVRDIVALIILFMIYLIWVNKSLSDFIKQTQDLVIYNKNTLPGMMFLDKIIAD